MQLVGLDNECSTREPLKLKPTIQEKIDLYPDDARKVFLDIRSIIFDVAKSYDLGEIEESLKWGQPSYRSKTDTTVRVDWHKETPESIGVFFDCKTILVETFIEIFADSLKYRGNRVVVLSLDAPVPEELETCIAMALNYHALKKLPLLGA